MKSFIPLLLAVIFAVQLKAQDYPYYIREYSFIDIKGNNLYFPREKNPRYNRLFKKYDDIIFNGNGIINVVHIGGSHLQAGYLSNKMAVNMQSFFPGLDAGRGFVFPYEVSHTNNPEDYTSSFTGEWETCKSVKRQHGCVLGLSGISVKTTSENANLVIKLRKNTRIDYAFDKVKIFHPNYDEVFSMKLTTSNAAKVVKTVKGYGYTTFYLDRKTSDVKFTFYKESAIQSYFELYGLTLEKTKSGVMYHAIGINGTSVPSYLKCPLLGRHLQGLNADWVILTLGTNDSYTENFRKDIYIRNYERLIEKIRHAVPDAAILLTVPNDSYLYGDKPNSNTQYVQSAIYELANKYNCAVWDFYEVMGGFNSVEEWHEAGLAKNDFLHFTKKGYILQADLLFNAFRRAYDDPDRPIEQSAE